MPPPHLESPSRWVAAALLAFATLLPGATLPAHAQRADAPRALAEAAARAQAAADAEAEAAEEAARAEAVAAEEDAWRFDGDLEALFAAPGEATPDDAAATPERDLGRVRAAVGVEYSRGRFGFDLPTESWVTPISLRYEWRALSLRASTSVISVNGPQVSLAGRGTLPGDTLTAVRPVIARERETGIGDLALGVGFAPTLVPELAPWLAGWPFVEITFDVKVPTANEKRLLGTGRFDYTLRLDLAQRFGRVTPFVSAGRTFTSGDLEIARPGAPGNPVVLGLRDAWLASAGFVLDVPGDVADFGVSYEFRESTVRSGRDGHELVPYVSIATPVGTLGPYFAIGLSTGSPDFAVGLQVSVAHDL